MQGNYDILLDLNATSPIKLPVTLENFKLENFHSDKKKFI